MNIRLFALLAVGLPFTAYTAVVVGDHGYTGFIELALAGAWGGQVFLDLVIALVLFTFWLVPDARERKLPALPYLVAITTLGSIGALAYLVHRELRGAVPVLERRTAAQERA